MNSPTWEHYEYYREHSLKQVCTCPTCHTVWAHKDSADWVRENFCSRTEPLTCSVCGTLSVAPPGKKMGPRKIYVEPTVEEVLARTAPPKSGWFGRKKAREESYEYERG